MAPYTTVQARLSYGFEDASHSVSRSLSFEPDFDHPFKGQLPIAEPPQE